VPPAWPGACREDENECSIVLRVDACGASILLTGDAEHEEEQQLDPRGAVTLLQVGHHGSATSTSPAFLAATQPKYAVISAGKPDEGLNRDYCHPRAIVVARLSQMLGPARATLAAFDGTRCDRATATDWVQAPTSERLWATERDGDVVLTTVGGGVFRRVM
jgi:competence protein ComEC